MRTVYGKRRKLMVELLRGLGFNILVLPQGAFYVFEDASKWTDDSYKFAFKLLEDAGVGVAPGVDVGQSGKRAVRFTYPSSKPDRPISCMSPLPGLLSRA
jgi:aspartate/methionine/tyrosine aminotransferase